MHDLVLHTEFPKVPSESTSLLTTTLYEIDHLGSLPHEEKISIRKWELVITQCVYFPVWSVYRWLNTLLKITSFTFEAQCRIPTRSTRLSEPLWSSFEGLWQYDCWILRMLKLIWLSCYVVCFYVSSEKKKKSVYQQVSTGHGQRARPSRSSCEQTFHKMWGIETNTQTA